MKVYNFLKKDLDAFISAISKTQTFIGPKKTNDTRFEVITSADELYLEKITNFPVKQWFFKQEEPLLQFKGGKVKELLPTKESKVVFGLRRCDLNSLQRQDMLYMIEQHDPYYSKRRESTIIIGYHCKQGDEWCFCNSLQLHDYYDLMFYDNQDSFTVEVGSETGQEFVIKYKQFFFDTDKQLTAKDKKIINTFKLNTTHIEKIYERQEWKQISDKCVSCGACNFLCPSCYCFEIEDDISLKDLTSVTRKRKWSSCQMPSFTRVAQDHVFRNDHNDMFKHRIYHQLEYFNEKYKETLCTGCGRCIRECPETIDWVSKVNEMTQ